MDYGGHYKLLHYTARNFFAPLLVSADYDKKTNVAAVFLTSDVNQPLAGTSLACAPSLPHGFWLKPHFLIQALSLSPLWGTSYACLHAQGCHWARPVVVVKGVFVG